MKLRIKGNSLRFRLTKSEVARFGETGLVEEVVEFGTSPDQYFSYVLSASDDIEEPAATLGNNCISVLLPRPLAEEWIQTDRVGVGARRSIARNTTFHILVEKDFACLEERPGEDETNNYPNPAAKTCRVGGEED